MRTPITRPAAIPHPTELPAPDPVGDADLVGMRREDLDHDERQRLISCLATERGATDRDAAMTLALAVSDLPPPPSHLHAGHVLEALAARRRTRRTHRAVAAAGAAAFVVAAVALTSGADAVHSAPTWDRPAVTLEGTVRADGRKRTLRDGDTVPADASVWLSTAVAGEGALFVSERWGYGSTHDVVPPGSPIGPGLHAFDTPLQAERAPLVVTYEVWLCPPGTTQPHFLDCSHDRIRATWR